MAVHCKIFTETDDTSETEVATLTREYETLAKCCTLGDIIQDHRFQNHVIDAIIEPTIAKRRYPITLAGHLFANLPPLSPPRRLIVDFWVYVSSKQWFEEAKEFDVKDGPSEFWATVAEGLVESRALRADRPWINNPCQYHIHPEGELKCDWAVEKEGRVN